ncbi:MAG: deoxynucleoside kinase [Anaerolineae bacterium]|nr:deoxynucleoside kinase [Anaerolineae bacterium]
MLVLLEGNIAAGKTTLGQVLAASDRFAFIPEPVERWQTGYAANLLDRFYTDTRRWAFTLQICAFVTRTQALQHPPDRQAIVFERSVYCDRHVFAKNLHQHGFMDDTEWALYLHFWEHLVDSAPIPDAIIYLRTPAEECFRRLRVRGRSEEKGIPLDYLQQLEQRHDEWLLNPDTAGKPVIMLDGMQPWTADTIWGKLAQVTADRAAG